MFALIYEGAANWAAADGVVTLYPATGPQVEVRLDDPRDGARICGIALLEPRGGDAAACAARSTTSTAVSVPSTRPTAGA